MTASPIRTRSFNNTGTASSASSPSSPGRGHAAGLCVVAPLAIPSMLSMVAEWWAAEARALIAGWIHAVDIPTIMAANGVVFMFTVVFYQIPKGLGIAASIRCGNALGSGEATEARGEAFMGLFTSGLVSIGSAAVYHAVAAKDLLGLLAGNQSVLELAVGISLPTSLCMVGFTFMMVSVQLLNSCGRNIQGTAVAFISCWAVGITASSVLALVLGQGLQGIWWGNACGLGVGAVIGVGAVCRVDWQEEVHAAQRRSAAKGLM